MRTYELLIIIKPDLDEEGVEAFDTWVQGIVTSNGGEIIKTEVMGRRRLAYTIKQQQDGMYVLVHAGLTREAISELERSLKLNEDVLRHLLVRLDETE